MTRDEYYALATKRNLGIVSEIEQTKLRGVRVAIAGMGGGGGIYLTTLARMGVGHFNVAEFDTFSVVNINRQVGATSSTIGRLKGEVMAEMARDIHPDVDVRLFDQGLTPGNVEAFLTDADIVIDGIDIFAFPARQLLYREARRLGKTVVAGAPLGLSGALSVFTPNGMSFDEYFDIREGMSAFEIMIAFVVGLTPSGTHWKYLDTSRVDPAEHAGPSSAAAISLIAGMVSIEAMAILLNRRPAHAAPIYQQFDPYRGVYRRGKLRWGNRGPLQRLKRFIVARKMAHLADKVFFDEMR